MAGSQNDRVSRQINELRASFPPTVVIERRRHDKLSLLPDEMFCRAQMNTRRAAPIMRSLDHAHAEFMPRIVTLEIAEWFRAALAPASPARSIAFA